MRKLLKIVVLILVIALIGGLFLFFNLTDLRSKEISYPNNPEKAKQLFKEMGEAHKIHLWDSINTYTAMYKDEFYGLLGTQSHPFKENEIEFSLKYIPKKYTGQAEILTGKEKGAIWGIQEGKTYSMNSANEVTLNNDKNLKFWLPTYQFFIELPMRIQEATALDYMGEKTINGIEVEGVIASWNTIDPQRDIDQYVVWINKTNKRIVLVEYTVREMYAFITGAAYYNNYKDYNGLPLPAEMPVESNLLPKGFLHKMSILNFKANTPLKQTLLPIN